MEAILIIRTRFSLRNYDLDWSMQILSKCSIRIHLVVVDIAGGGKSIVTWYSKKKQKGFNQY